MMELSFDRRSMSVRGAYGLREKSLDRRMSRSDGHSIARFC